MMGCIARRPPRLRGNRHPLGSLVVECKRPGLSGGQAELRAKPRKTRFAGSCGSVKTDRTTQESPKARVTLALPSPLSARGQATPIVTLRRCAEPV